MRKKVGKSQNTVFFQWFVAPEGRKVGSLKQRVRSHLARCELKNCTPLWREAHFEVKMYKTHHVRSTPLWREAHFEVNMLKHQGFGPLLAIAMSKKCMLLLREAHVEVKMYKTHQVRTTFGSWDVEKVHAVVARSRFRSENAQNTAGYDHFWKLRCRKSARRCGAKHISKENAQTTPGSDHFGKFRCRKSARGCGAKHISKSKCTKHTILGPLVEVDGSWDVEKVHAVVARTHFEVNMLKHQGFGPLLAIAMSKKCMPLWREAHVEVKMHKTQQVRATFGSWDVEKAHAVVAKTCRSETVQNTPGSDHFWKLRCRKSARRCGAKHISKWKCTKHTRFGPLLEVEMSKKCTPLWREAHFEVKMTKYQMFAPLLEVAMSKKCTRLWREAHFQVNMYKTHHSGTTFGSSDVEKSARRRGAKHISKSKCTKYQMIAPLLEVEMSFARGRRKGLRILSKVSKSWGFCSMSTKDGRHGTFEEKRICKDLFSVAGAVQETWHVHQSCQEVRALLGGVAFWSIRSSGLLRWFCVTGAALRITWHHFFVAGAVV